MAGPGDPCNCFVGAPTLVAGRPGAITVAVKDNFDVAGLPTGAGLGRSGLVPQTDAAIVQELRRAGFGLIGKTMMDEAALGGSGENPHHGRTQNPRAPGHSPGGSSGGSAAAVASGLCAAALGTDTLGSVRIPASYCGVVGFKPSRGLLSLDGVVPLSPTLDHAGVLGATAAVVAELFEGLTGSGVPIGRPGRLRIGVPHALDEVAVDGPTRSAFAGALALLADCGWTVTDCVIEAWDPPAARRSGLLVAEAEGAVIHAAMLSSDSPALSPGLRRLLAFGRDCDPARLARARRTLLQAALGVERCLTQYDLIALPTVPSPAFAWSAGPSADQADLTALANFGGQPAISIPIGTTPDGRPIGLQLIGRLRADALVIQAARFIQRSPAAPGSAETDRRGPSSVRSGQTPSQAGPRSP